MGQPGSDADPPRIGRFRLEEQLGAGGVGVVYAAHDPELGRRVAVKLVRPDRLGTDPAAAGQKLRKEAQAMAKLSHPNVVAVYDVGEHEGGVYIAMELVEGRSLRDWMMETPRPWREVLNMYFQAGRGLAAAHEAGVVHRDFKPANVLVGRDGRARVVDFGLASVGQTPLPRSIDPEDIESTSVSGRYHRPTDLGDLETTIDESGMAHVARGEVDVTGAVEAAVGGGWQASSRTLGTATQAEHTIEGSVGVTQGSMGVGPGPGADPSQTLPGGASHSGVIVGTPAYMAPEQFLGRPADARSDQFSLCVALYEGFYGRRPFVGKTAIAIAEEVLSGRIAAPPERTRVPRWIHAIVERGLATHRQDRHPSVRSMLASIAFLGRVMLD